MALVHDDASFQFWNEAPNRHTTLRVLRVKYRRQTPETRRFASVHSTALRQHHHSPTATGRLGSLDHSLHKPAYSLGPRNPACSNARTLWHAVTPEPQ